MHIFASSGLRVVARVILALALVAAAQPAAAQSHKLKIYTVKKPIKIESGITSQLILSCKGGDHVLDGHWQVGKVTAGGDPLAIEVSSSHGLSGTAPGEDGVWYFKLFNPTAGTAKVNLFLTCLARATKGGDHAHNFALDDWSWETVVQDQPLGPYERQVSVQCDEGAIAVAVGFNFEKGAGRIFRSYPSSNARSYQAAFMFTSAPGQVKLFYRCLHVTTTATNGHTHDIVWSQVPSFAGSLRHVAAGAVAVETLACNDQQLSAAPFWWIDDPYHVSSLGVDDNLTDRGFAFRFDGGGSDNVSLSHFCFDKTLGPPVTP